jgi:COP9 signalosome complex subunit 1
VLELRSSTANSWLIPSQKGRTRFNRLYLIGTCSSYLAVDALKAAIAEAKSGKDVARYLRAVQALADVAPNEPEATIDSDWVERSQKVVKAETDRLEHELRGYKNNLIKESIRVCVIASSLTGFIIDIFIDGK